MNRKHNDPFEAKYQGKNPADFDTFHEKIICARINYDAKTKDRRKNLSQNAAAKKIKITPAYLCKLEKGLVSRPSADVVFRIENVYGFQKGELAEFLANNK